MIVMLQTLFADQFLLVKLETIFYFQMTAGITLLLSSSFQTYHIIFGLKVVFAAAVENLL